MSSKEQISIMKKEMKKEISTLKSLPKEHAKERAKKSLIEIGVIDRKGKVKRAYSGGFTNA